MNAPQELVYRVRAFVAEFNMVLGGRFVLADSAGYCIDAPQFCPAGSIGKNVNGYVVVSLFNRERP